MYTHSVTRFNILISARCHIMCLIISYGTCQGTYRCHLIAVVNMISGLSVLFLADYTQTHKYIVHNNVSAVTLEWWYAKNVAQDVMSEMKKDEEDGSFVQLFRTLNICFRLLLFRFSSLVTESPLTRQWQSVNEGPASSGERKEP